MTPGRVRAYTKALTGPESTGTEATMFMVLWQRLRHFWNSCTLQALVDKGLVESRRGVGIFVRAGARKRLLSSERDQFLNQEWPALRAKLQRLGLGANDLNWEAI